MDAAASPVVVTTVGPSGSVGRSGRFRPSAAIALVMGPQVAPPVPPPPGPPPAPVGSEPVPPAVMSGSTAATTAGDADGVGVAAGVSDATLGLDGSATGASAFVGSGFATA